MDKNSLAYASYWRNSLADADLGFGRLKAAMAKDFTQLSKDQLASGCIGKPLVDACFEGESEKVECINVVIRPKVYRLTLEHSKQQRKGLPEIVAPIVTSALLSRDGRLYPFPTTVVPRDLLEPLEKGSFSIGSLADLDSFLTTDGVPGIEFKSRVVSEAERAIFQTSWARYLEGCRRLLQQVAETWTPNDLGFQLADYCWLVKKKTFRGSSKYILELYDHLRGTDVRAPLFDHFARAAIYPPEPCLSANAMFSERLGHASSVFSLAETQRNALSHLLAAREGEILAVNGPPGTGKTTLLLSVVASLWAKAAIDGREPPVILAASTNNQAVTNILDAFGRDFSLGEGPFAGRWLPNVKSFGVYLPARERANESAGKYLTRSFFERVESWEYVTEAQSHYLKRAAQAFPQLENLTVKSTIANLQQAICDEARKLGRIEAEWLALSSIRDTIRNKMGDSPRAMVDEYRERLGTLKAEKQAFCGFVKHWEIYLAQEPLLYLLLSWLPPVAKKRFHRARSFLLSELLLKPDLENCHDIDEIGRGIRMLGNRLDDAVEKCVELVRQGERLLEDESKALTAWREAMAVLGIEEDAESLSINNCEAVADQTIRFKIFLLSTHYWEGRWLLDMDEVLPKLENEKHKNGRVAEMQRWYRRMKLTPCAVSTFYMLPSWMKICQKKGDNFVDNYLYGFADLLIVDEAGQARPDLAGPAFALAKKALIVGDTLQLEPIWSIPHQVDKGNLRTVGLLRNDNYETDYEHLSEIGKSVASGSVMRIAQGATRYHSDSDLARGLFLYEHCRCYDEIIGFCNELCYRGKLIPLRGKRPRADEEKDWLPAMGYLHIDGLCQSCSGGTRQNLLEAETIAAWLCQRKGELEKLYGKPLHKIVGVITPFGGQVVAITRACNKLGIKVGDGKEELTVGTVHSLQGAERPIVIFSPVYSKHSDGPFIDKNLSMLNVTVSRARDSFLIFGDMDVFELIDKVQPRGLLGAYLFRDPGNALRFEYRPREDLLSPRTNLRVLRDAPEHDDFLLKVLLNVRREFGIVSPWLFLHRIEQIGALNGMISAIQRGVNVNVYTDLELNTNDGSKQRRAEQRNMLLSALESLRNHGIKTFLVKRVHSKVVVADDNVFCVGSFNWFSANRDDRYAKHETSMAYQGADLAAEIVAMRKSLELRVVQQRI